MRLRRSTASNWREHLYIGQEIVKTTSLKVRADGWRVNRRGVDFVTPTGKKIELTTPGRVNAHFAKGGDYKTVEYSTYTRDRST
jgi:hypothetical protein